MKYRVRFHLQNGKNYMHWQIREVTDDDKLIGSAKDAKYLDPAKCQIEMTGCKLVNDKSKAMKVHNAGKKDVSGWVLCDNYIPRYDDTFPVDNLERLRYNPIVDPVWRREDDEGDFDWDNYHFDSLVTDGNRVYVLEERCYA